MVSMTNDLEIFSIQIYPRKIFVMSVDKWNVNMKCQFLDEQLSCCLDF